MRQADGLKLQFIFPHWGKTPGHKLWGGKILIGGEAADVLTFQRI